MTHRIRLLTACMGIWLFFAVGMPVQAADFSAGTAQELIDAIDAANANSEADTITLTADITLDAFDNQTEGNNGLPVISTEITIEGAGFTIARDNTITDTFRIFYVDSSGGNLTLNNVTIENGLATDGDDTSFSNADSGGGIFNIGTVTVSNSTLSGNSAGNDGGGISNGGSLTVSNSTLSGNSARNDGGGIFNIGALTVSNSTLSGNTADRGGGIFNRDGGTVTVSNSTLSGNSARNNGGGISNILFGALTVSNSTLSGNSAGNDGGGISNILFSRVMVSNSTLSGNTADRGGGISNVHDSEVTLADSIIAASTGSGCINFGRMFTGDNNLDDDGTCPNSSPITPGTHYETTLADNGGPTLTHALQSGSPAIDGSGTVATSADQRGAPAVNTRDIGAYEFNGDVPTVSFTVDETTLTEGGSITQATVTFTVTNYNAAFDVSFAFTGDAIASDYTTTYSGPYTINSDGDTTFTIDIVDDNLDDNSETLDLELQVVRTADITGTNPQSIAFEDNDGTGADVNGDGIVSPSDAIYVLNRLGSGDLSADVNGDNRRYD